MNCIGQTITERGSSDTECCHSRFCPRTWYNVVDGAGWAQSMMRRIQNDWHQCVSDNVKETVLWAPRASGARVWTGCGTNAAPSNLVTWRQSRCSILNSLKWINCWPRQTGKHWVAGWLIGWEKFTIPQTHYSSYQGQVFTAQMTQPTVSKHWRKVLRIRLQSHHVHSTVLQ